MVCQGVGKACKVLQVGTETALFASSGMSDPLRNNPSASALASQHLATLGVGLSVQFEAELLCKKLPLNACYFPSEEQGGV